MKKIEITVSTTGDVEIEVDGVSGNSCMELTREIEHALGKMTQKTAKPAMNQSTQQGFKQNNTQGQG